MFYDPYFEEELFEDDPARLPMCNATEVDLQDLLLLIQSFNKDIRLLRKLLKQKPRNQEMIDRVAARARKERVTLENQLELMRSRTRRGWYLRNGCTRKDLAKLTYVVRKLRGPWRNFLKIENLRDKLVYWLRHSRGAYATASCARLFGRDKCREVKRLIRNISRSGAATKP